MHRSAPSPRPAAFSAACAAPAACRAPLRPAARPAAPAATAGPAALVLLAALALLAAPAALAHPGHEHAAAAGSLGASLAAGLLHPPTGLDHLGAMVVLGMWSAMTARRIWLAPLAFALVLLAGALLGLGGVPLPAVEPMIATSLLVLGLLTATRARLPEAAGAVVAGLFALFHGHAHGGELPAGAIALPYIAGFMLATVALHCVGIAGGLALRRAHAWAARLLGGGIALYGAALLAG